MATQLSFVPLAEAIFIGDVSAPQMNRLIDEELVPASLLMQVGGVRKFARITAAFAKFFFETEPMLAASARKIILRELTQRIESVQAKNRVFSLQVMPGDINWMFIDAKLGVTVDVGRYVADAMARASDVDRADQLIIEDPGIMGGVPCFAGTRVPIENVLGSLDKDISKERVLKSYPFLTDAHLEAARIYTKVHPRKGRPRRLSESNHADIRKVTRVIRPARA
ncbi:MAG: DUF433 domain-containing protein [Rhodoferax sp.]|nr:DUF433 domain-containing protein [Rhodoferax sp.]